MWSVASLAYAATYPAFGLAGIGDVAGLPLLLLFTGIVSTLLSPPELAWSRWRESRADLFSLELTHNPQAFASSMIRLHDQNLSIAHPHRWETWLLYTHPPGRDRVDAARKFRGDVNSQV